MLDHLPSLISAVDYNLYQPYELEEKKRIAIRDINDWLIVAVLLMLDYPIWKEDIDFFGTEIEVIESIYFYLE